MFQSSHFKLVSIGNFVNVFVKPFVVPVSNHKTLFIKNQTLKKKNSTCCKLYFVLDYNIFTDPLFPDVVLLCQTKGSSVPSSRFSLITTFPLLCIFIRQPSFLLDVNISSPLLKIRPEYIGIYSVFEKKI